ncbi:MAG: Pycsar system effector family protein [Chitinophagales bacterium]
MKEQDSNAALPEENAKIPEEKAKKSKLLKKAKKHIFQFFKERLDSMYVYHDYTHTFETVEAVGELGLGNGLKRKELEMVQLAAWFHDTGYVDTVEGHEEASLKYVRAFLEEQEYPAEKINIIEGCILSTKMPQSPKNIYEEILCDADLYHLGSKNFFEKSSLLRLEWANRNALKGDEVGNLEAEIAFLSTHHYHTPFGQLNLNKRKFKNVSVLKQNLQIAKDDKNKRAIKQAEVERKIARDDYELERKKNKDEMPERGIETMFRISLRNHISLSAIADSKANTMLSVNAMILSISFSFLVPQFGENPALFIPTIMLLLVCMLAIIAATLSTIPKVTMGTFTKEDIHQKKVNLLFFGNFFNVDLGDYEWGMKEMMKDRDYLYGSLIRDLYFLGKVLAKKYRYLRYCYNIFMYGLLITMVAFVVVFGMALK